MTHVADYKKEIVAKIKDLAKKYPIIGCVDMESLPTPQLQNMRAQLRGKVELFMAKKRLIKVAFEDLKKDIKGIEKLEEHMKGMPALLFTKENPFSLYQMLDKNKSSAPAKGGQIAPKDIVVPAGPTPFAPGPIISELGNVGIKSGIENGKVAVKEDSLVVKEGEEISAELASILTRLKIEPMEIGLALTAVFENGEIMTKSILAIDPEEYIENVSKLAREAFLLATEVGYICEETVMPMLTKAASDAMALSVEVAYPTKDNVDRLVTKAEAQANAVNSIAS
jgi:large subunit ribosomal protein L10